MATHRLTSASVLEPEEDLTPQIMQQTATPPEHKPKPWERLSNLSKTTKLRLKIGFSLVIFASLFIFGKIDLTKTWEVASKANPAFLALAAALVVGSTFINAFRWQVLARAVGLDRPLLPLVQYCFVGCFFNLFLPSTVGGDVSRCYYISKGTGKYKAALYSVLADRVVGISVLFLLACAGLFFGPGSSELPLQMKVPIILGTIGIFVGIPLLPTLSQMILGKHHWITQRFMNSAFKVYWHDKKLIGLSLAQSMGLQVVLVGAHILIGLSLGLTQVPVWYYCVFYPLVAVLGFVTPSFNGIGVREGAYTYFLMLPVAGVDKTHAFAFAMILLGMNTFLSLVGGLVYVAGHFKFSEQEAEKLQHDVIDEPENVQD
jgi:glycosyltransferase 2 family protein